MPLIPSLEEIKKNKFNIDVNPRGGRPLLKGRQDVTNKIFGGMEYADVFREAYKNLNQPNAPEDIISGGTTQLADNFIERVYEKTGDFPSESQVRDFVAANLTPSYAEKYIKGTITNDSTKSGLVDPYLSINSDVFLDKGRVAQDQLQAETAKRTEDVLQRRLDSLFGVQSENVTRRINDLFADTRKQALEEEAALGSRLTSPASILTSSRIDEGRMKATSDALAQLASSQAAGQLDVTKAIEGGLAAERRAGEAGQQFRQELGLKNRLFNLEEEDRYYKRGQEKEALGVAERVGKAQAESKKPGNLDYANTAINALNTLLTLFPRKGAR